MVPNDRDVQRALEDGARRSREASERHLMLSVREALTPEVLWRRFKWGIVALGLFALLELLSLGKLISVMGTKF